MLSYVVLGVYYFSTKWVCGWHGEGGKGSFIISESDVLLKSIGLEDKGVALFPGLPSLQL